MFEFSVFVFLGFAGSSCCGPLWKPVLARRLKCRCRLPAGFVPPTCTVFLLHIKCICKSCLYFLLALCLYLYLPSYFSCYVVQGSRVLLERPALGTRSRTTAAARGKNSTLATRLNFAQKIGSSLEMGLSVGPILAKFCATGATLRFP